jgi:hypothetical protein
MMTVSLRLTPSQLEKVDEAAARLGLDRARWMRAVIYAQLAREAGGEAEPASSSTTINGPAAWITRSTTTVRHVRGLLTAFENANVDNYAAVRILAVDDERGVSLPNGAVITRANLPLEGIVYIPE